MIDMALLSVIRRWHFREGVPIREVARRTGLSRNTVKKYLASGEVEPRYQRKKTPSKLDDYEHTLNSWLYRESRKNRKQRKTAKSLYNDLVLLGYTGSYDRVAAFSRNWKREQGIDKQAFIPLQFALGEAFQFDWSEDYVVIAGVNTKLQVAHTKLSYSRAFMVRAYLLQTHEMLFDAHFHSLSALGGVPERGIYDNMKTAVDKVGKGKERAINKRFLAMTSHYLFEPDFCNTAAGWEKGQVEKSVRDARPRFFHDAPAFNSLSELNAWLEQHCIQSWKETAHPDFKQQSIYEVWQEEKARLMPMPQAFDGYVEHSKRVSSTCLVTFERNRYSVPASYANQVISLHVYADRLEMTAQDTVIAVHKRIFNRQHDGGQTIYDWRHYVAVLQRKPGALRNGAPFNEMPKSFRQLQKRLLKHKGGDREMADILALTLQYPEAQLINAVDEALQSDHPSKEHVLNCLNRQQQAKEPTENKSVITPEKLTLETEPKANTQRYDQLRGLH